MRFFTMDWWLGVQTGSTVDPSTEYARHVASFRPFPDVVAAIDRVPSLHDARVRRVEHLVDAVDIVLDAWGETGGWHPLRLSYRGVEAFTIAADPEKALRGPGGFGDLGYSEIDVPSPGLFEHRLLFSSGIELGLRFREFSFSWGALAQGAAGEESEIDR